MNYKYRFCQMMFFYLRNIMLPINKSEKTMLLLLHQLVVKP